MYRGRPYCITERAHVSTRNDGRKSLKAEIVTHVTRSRTAKRLVALSPRGGTPAAACLATLHGRLVASTREQHDRHGQRDELEIVEQGLPVQIRDILLHHLTERHPSAPIYLPRASQPRFAA